MNRRRLLATAIGAVGAAAAIGVVGISQAATTPETGKTVEPVGGAGLFDVDPDQGDVSQDPNAVVTGDVTALPEDAEF